MAQAFIKINSKFLNFGRAVPLQRTLVKTDSDFKGDTSIYSNHNMIPSD